ncbi:MAG: hypothetical protein AAF203_06680, partial [Pseudomonadota bacterium]
MKAAVVISLMFVFVLTILPTHSLGDTTIPDPLSPEAGVSGWIPKPDCVPRKGQTICDFTTENERLAEDDMRIFEWAMIQDSFSSWKVPMMPQSAFHDEANNCESYYKKDGTYGPKLRLLAKELLGEGRSTDRYRLFFVDPIPGIEQVCPTFPKMHAPDRLRFWLWFFTAIAREESQCGMRRWSLNTKDPNGTSAGDFQMPEAWKKEVKRADGSIGYAGRFKRGPGCNAKEPKVDGYLMFNYNNVAPCAVEVFGESMYGCYNNKRVCTGVKRPWSKSGIFWAKLIRADNRGPILARVKQYPL